MAGWICLWRKIQEWEWWLANSDILKVFIYLLCNANTKDREWKGRSMIIKRGQLVTTRRTIALGTGLSERSVRTCLEHLKESADIDIKPTNKFSIISICNYDTYQQQKEENRQQNDQQTANKKSGNRPTKSPATDQQKVHANNNINNITKKQLNKETNFDSFLCLSALSSGTTENGNTIVENFSDFENSEIAESENTDSDTTEEVETEKEKSSGKRENENFDDTATNSLAVIQANQPAEKTPLIEKNTANTQMLLTCPTANDKSTQIATRYDDIIAWFNNQVSNSGIRKIRSFNSDREAMIRKIVKQYGWEQVKQALHNAKTSKFLTGKTEEGFAADFDFIFNKKKFPRILDGFYNKTDQSVKLVADIATNGVNTVMSACSLFDKDFFKKVNDNLKNGKPL